MGLPSGASLPSRLSHRRAFMKRTRLRLFSAQRRAAFENRPRFVPAPLEEFAQSS